MLLADYCIEFKVSKTCLCFHYGWSFLYACSVFNDTTFIFGSPRFLYRLPLCLRYLYSLPPRFLSSQMLLVNPFATDTLYPFLFTTSCYLFRTVILFQHYLYKSAYLFCELDGLWRLFHSSFIFALCKLSSILSATLIAVPL